MRSTSELLTNIIKPKITLINIETKEATKNPINYNNKKHSKIINIGYFLGITFTISGIIQEDNNNNKNIELPIGLTLLTSTVILNQYKTKNNRNIYYQSK